MSTFVLQSGFNTRIATDTVRHAVYRYRTITRSDRNTYYGGSGWDKGPENNHALITVAPGEVPAEIATADQKKNRSRSWFSGDYSDIAIFDNRDDALRLIALLETLHVPGDLDVILRATEGTAAELAHPTLEQFLRLSRGKSKAATTAAEWMSEHLGNELLPQLVDAVEEELDSGSPKVRTLRPLLAACTQMILGPGQDVVLTHSASAALRLSNLVDRHKLIQEAWATVCDEVDMSMYWPYMLGETDAESGGPAPVRPRKDVREVTAESAGLHEKQAEAAENTESVAIPFTATQVREYAKRNGARWQPESKTWRMSPKVATEVRSKVAAYKATAPARSSKPRRRMCPDCDYWMPHYFNSCPECGTRWD